MLKKAMHGEFCKWGRQLGSGYKYDGHRVLLISMGLEIRKGRIVTARSWRRLGRIVVHTDQEVRSVAYKSDCSTALGAVLARDKVEAILK
jgi:hypothetical protein